MTKRIDRINRIYRIKPKGNKIKANKLFDLIL